MKHLWKSPFGITIVDWENGSRMGAPGGSRGTFSEKGPNEPIEKEVRFAFCFLAKAVLD